MAQPDPTFDNASVTQWASQIGSSYADALDDLELDSSFVPLSQGTAWQDKAVKKHRVRAKQLVDIQIQLNNL